MKAPGVSGKRRLFYMLAIIAAIFVALMVRLFYIQVIQGAELQEKALSQWTRDTALSAERGRILDSDGAVLAQSGTAYKILVWPQVIKQTLSEAGLDAGRLAALAQQDDVKAELVANTQRAFERGAFGSPTFFVGDDIFFGKDRLRDVEEAVAARQGN